MKNFILNPEYYLILLFLGVFILTLLSLPRIRNISFKFGFIAEPDHRSSHQNIVPTFGGVSFYIALILTLFFIQNIDVDNVIITMIASMSIMFFTGLKDDFHNISAKSKTVGQFLSVGLLMIHSEFRVDNLYGFLSIYELHPIISVLFSVFLLIGLINAYNLIDGIDGLASITGIVIATSFGLLFYSLDLYFYLAICVALVSMLFAFLRYNFSSKKKIFMGDTGSLLIGLILGILAMKLLSIGFSTVSSIAITRSEIPILILGILIIPAFDVSRVIFIRLSHKLPVFSPDRNHIHHILVDAGLTHKKASIFVGFINSIIIASVYFTVRYFGVIASILVLFFLLFVLTYVLFILNKRFQAKKKKVKLRKFLFKVSTRISNNKQKYFSSESRIAFNRKLKMIRILFF